MRTGGIPHSLQIYTSAGNDQNAQVISLSNISGIRDTSREIHIALRNSALPRKNLIVKPTCNPGVSRYTADGSRCRRQR